METFREGVGGALFVVSMPYLIFLLLNTVMPVFGRRETE
jgi:hypothetical protein